MKKFNFSYLVCVALCIVLSGCGAMNFNQMISKRLDTEMLHSKL
jgi:heme O synthase-like polyprenyltransferase